MLIFLSINILHNSLPKNKNDIYVIYFIYLYKKQSMHLTSNKPNIRFSQPATTVTQPVTFQSEMNATHQLRSPQKIQQ